MANRNPSSSSAIAATAGTHTDDAATSTTTTAAVVVPPNNNRGGTLISSSSPSSSSTTAATMTTIPSTSFNTSTPLLPLPHGGFGLPPPPHSRSHSQSQSILGRPPSNPPPPPPPPPPIQPQGILYPRGGGFPAKPAAAIRPPDHSNSSNTSTPTTATNNSNPSGYLRSSSSGMAVQQHQISRAPSFGFSPHGDPHHHAIHVQQQQQMRPPPPPPPPLPPQLQFQGGQPTSASHHHHHQQQQQQHHHHHHHPQFAATRPVGGVVNGLPPAPPSRNLPPFPPHPKASFPASTLVPECTNFKDLREKQRDDSVATVHDRKVRFPNGASRSLYALCRSWVRNESPQEIQSGFAGVKLLPRPLPLTAVDGSVSKKNAPEEDETTKKEEHADSVENLSPNALLDGYIKRAKRIRAQLKEERLQRIERYKQRLSLLLPPPMEANKNNDAVQGS